MTERPDPELRYADMARLARAAADVRLGHAAVSSGVFDPVPGFVPSPQRETMYSREYTDAHYAVTAAWYVPIYGPLSEPAYMTCQPGTTIGGGLDRWSALLEAGFEASSSIGNFRRMFFEGGMWQVFFDPAVPLQAAYRRRLERPDFDGLQNSDKVSLLIANLHARLTVRSSWPHATSHRDVCRYANSILAIGETELGLRSPHDLAVLLRESLQDIRRPALLNVFEMNTLANALIDPTDLAKWRRQFLQVDPAARKIGLNMPAIETMLHGLNSPAAALPRRGCPVLYLRTLYGDQEVPIFAVMFNVITRMYSQTGALTNRALRVLDLPPARLQRGVWHPTA